jgi:hypothetical protein
MSAKTVFNSQWTSFLFLLPFILLFGLHNALGVSNALMVLADDYPGRAKVFGMDAQLYNLIMSLALVGGIFAYWMHTAYLSGGSKHKNRVSIFISKTVFLVLYCVWVAFLMNYTEGK